MSTDLLVPILGAGLAACGWIILRIESIGRKVERLEVALEALELRVARVETLLDRRT